MRKPETLQSGDTVMIVAPASAVNIEQVMQGKAKLEQLGLNVIIGQSVFEKRAYLAGSNAVRARDLHEAFANKNVKAVICARGGYGSGRLLPLLDFDLIRLNPKIFWGYSDITALHIAILQEANFITFHGPMVQELGGAELDELTISSFQQLFQPTALIFSAIYPNIYPSFSHSVTAPLVGGNLTILTSTLGTPYEIDTTDKILFIEDVDEEPYRIDRMLNQLRLAGKFDGCLGIVLGDFHNCLPNNRKESLTISEVVYDHIVPYGMPILSGFPIGHCKPNHGIPLGALVTMDGLDQALVFEPGVK
jgi:muramoyltetrapeptide carboxypeptidase